MKLDPLQRSVKAAFEASVVGQFEALLAERSKWQRRLTIAQGKLAIANIEIARFAGVLSTEADAAGRKGKVLS